jgi:glutamate-1-semialdehyde 2,1-aminomutase
VFLLSTTHGAETHTLAAGIATMNVYRDEDVVGHLHRQGTRLRNGVRAAAEAAGVQTHVDCVGRDCALLFTTLDGEGRPSQAFRTLFMQELIQRGVLAPSFMVSYSHSEALRVYRRALDEGVEQFVVGRPIKPVFRARG